MNAGHYTLNSGRLTAMALVDPSLEGFPIVYYNQELDRLFGKDGKTIIGQPIVHLFQHQLNTATADKLLAALHKAQETTFDVEYANGNHTEFASQITVSPLLSGEGQLTHMLVAKTIRPTVQENQQQLEEAHLFLESAPDATFIFDSDGQMILTNREAELLFGYTREELAAKTIEELMPERFRTGHIAHRLRFSKTPTVRAMGAGTMIVALTKSGQEIPVDIRLGPIVSQGKSYVSATVRNIEGRVRVALELEEARDVAEQATAEKSRFLAAASHDLRQPLQAITLYLSVLGRTEDATLRNEVSAKIQLSLDNINSMLGALLDVSKFESGAVAPEKTNVALSGIFDEIVAGCTQQANEKGLSLLAADTNTIVYSDPALLKRVIENFVTNAIRYTHNGNITINCDKQENEVIISVSDTGIGIDAKHLEQIFEAYYQLGNPMRNRTQGLGLGLSIVRNIAQLLDHPIHVESEIGKGSKFSICVPLVRKTASEPETLPEEQSVAHSGQDKPLVLLIDDDNDVRDSMSMLLDSLGFDVRAGIDGANGLDLLHQGADPAMIISDYWLPGMNGFEFLKRARLFLQHDVPAVLMTGDTTTNGLTNHEIANCQVIHKPVDTDRMIHLIESAVNTKTARP